MNAINFLDKLTNILNPIISNVIFPIIVAYIGFKYKNFFNEKEKEQKEYKERNIAIDAILKDLARMSILNRVDKAVDRGYTTLKEYEEINEVYEGYRNLHGNGTVEHAIEDFYKKLLAENIVH